MNTLLEILKYTLPSLIVIAAVYVIIRLFFEREAAQRKGEISREITGIITPIRLQAYERIVLFLERLSPTSLIMRLNQPNMTSQQFQVLLLNSIREEYEHNLSQQVYISQKAWEMVRNGKEEMIKLINTAGSSLEEEASSNDLAQRIFTSFLSDEKSPQQNAIDFVKKEIAQFF